jgi:uncharacterized radical SAM protein YgiQ
LKYINMPQENIKFMPMTRAEMQDIGWSELDILLVTGDCYVDHPSYGVAVIGRLLLDMGFRVGIVAQPDWKNPESLQVMGRPRIACCISSGNMDSMVNIYTAARRFRREDAFSENGETGKRPPHAVVVYAQLAKQAFSGLPIILGGIEASLRRVVHYDYWQDKLRQSVLVDSKADILVYGMGEKPIRQIFERLVNEKPLAGIRGTAILLGKKDAEKFNFANYMELPSWEEHKADKDALMQSTKLIESEMNPYSASGMFQRYGDRVLLIEPPPEPLSKEEMDAVYDWAFSNCPHPSYKGRIPAYETIHNSIPAVRGCPGGCAFCGLVSHQGRMIMSRSHDSVLREVNRMLSCKNFRGTISDIGGAAGNIYDSGPIDTAKCARCKRTSCVFPSICKNYQFDGTSLVKLLRKVRSIPGVKHLHINSGVRLDLALQQKELLKELIHHHVSGHLKVAPEHLHPKVLKYMRKSSAEEFYEFMRVFEQESKAVGKEQYLIPLFISNFPGCSDKEMKVVDDFLNKHNWSPQQVQDYIPLPMTMGGAMYYTGKAPDGTPIHVNRGLKERRPQMKVLKKKRRRPFRPDKKQH